MQDCDRALNSMRTVCDNEGAIVPGLANRNGHRYSKAGTNAQGGAKIKIEKMSECRWIHPLIINMKDERRKEIVSRHASSLQSYEKDESDIDNDSLSTENEHVD